MTIELTDQMQKYAQDQVDAGDYADVSEVVRAGMRLLMEREGARQFYALKSDLAATANAVESGAFQEFAPQAFDPDAFASQKS